MKTLFKTLPLLAVIFNLAMPAVQAAPRTRPAAGEATPATWQQVAGDAQPAPRPAPTPRPKPQPGPPTSDGEK